MNSNYIIPNTISTTGMERPHYGNKPFIVTVVGNTARDSSGQEYLINTHLSNIPMNTPTESSYHATLLLDKTVILNRMLYVQRVR